MLWLEKDIRRLIPNKETLGCSTPQTVLISLYGPVADHYIYLYKNLLENSFLGLKDNQTYLQLFAYILLQLFLIILFMWMDIM